MPPATSNPAPTPAARTVSARSFARLSSPLPAVLLALLCFAPTLGHGFNYDDIPLVEQNPRIRALSEFRDIWLSDWWRAPQGASQPLADPTRDLLYRPLTLFSFALNYAVHGLRPFGYHLVNVLLHAATCWLVWRLTRRLLGGEIVAAIAAAWFAVHPIHAEAVASVVGRAELLATCLALLGLEALLAPRGAPGRTRLALAAACLLAAMLGKESAVSAPLIGWVLLRWQTRQLPRTTRAEMERAAWLLAPLVAYFVLRTVALEGTLIRQSPYSLVFNPLVDAVGGAHLAGVLMIFGHYLRLLVLPAALSSDYGLGVIDPHHVSDPMLPLGAAGAIGLIVALSGWGRRSSGWRLAALLATCFALSYALISNVVLTIGVAAAERLFYWPSVFAIVGGAGAIVALARRLAGAGAVGRSRIWPMAGGLALLALAARSAMRGNDWRDDITLFRTDVAVWPRSAQLNFALGLLLVPEIYASRDPTQHAALLEEAGVSLDRALTTWPRFPAALRTRGEVYYLAGDAGRAQQFIEAALYLDPRDSIAQRMLLRLKPAGSQPSTRAVELHAAVERDPQNVGLLMQLAQALMDAGDPPAALAPAAHAAELEPRNPAALRLYAQALILNTQTQAASELLGRLLYLDPSDWESHANLSSLLAEQDPAASLAHAQSAARLRPDDLRVRVNLAEALAQNGHEAAALNELLRVERDLPAGHPFTAAIRGRIEELRRRLP